MPRIPLSDVIASCEAVERYGYRAEYGPLLIVQGHVDLSTRTHEIEFGPYDEPFPQAVARWRGRQGIGRRLGKEGWVRLHDRPPPNYLEMATALLRQHEPIAATTDGSIWQLSFQPEHVPLRDNPVEFFTRLYGEPHDEADRAFFDRVVEMASQLEAALTMRISREQGLIREVVSSVTSGDMRASMTVTFDFTRELPATASEPTGVLETPGLAPGELLLELGRFTGWFDLTTHSPWAQRSLQLIEESDSEGRYREIYHTSWDKGKFTESVARDENVDSPDESLHHPIVLGAFHEDATGQLPSWYKTWLDHDPKILANPSFGPNGYQRDYHHYGAKDKGVKWAWYFWFRGYPPTTVGDSYYSARDWGYGIDEGLNRLSFREAIRQYNKYSWEGKRAAYLIIGHVVHLLQDVAQPDHGRLVPHPGSGMDKKHAYKRYKYCHIVATEAALAACAGCWAWCFICAPAAFGIAEAACWAAADDDVMGYEKLIGECWNLSRVEGKIRATGVLKQPDYDTYFAQSEACGLTEADSRNLGSALGCTWLKLIPPVPNAEPAIDSTDPQGRQPYLELTDAIMPKVVGLSAGLIEHFFEIVNHPPYVQRVLAFKGASGLKPIGFGHFDPLLDGGHCAKVQLRYDASWIQEGMTRTKETSIDKPLSPSHRVYFFVQFGPTLNPGGSKAMDHSSLTMRLKGATPDGTAVSSTVSLQEASDTELGTYYWCEYQPATQPDEPYSLTLEIEGNDASAHLAQRPLPGYALDASPHIVAWADAADPPLYPLVGYQPGADKNHSIQVGPTIKPDLLEVNNSFTTATALDLGISQAPLLGMDSDPGAIVLEHLTLHDQADADYFRIDFEVGEHDEGARTDGWTQDVGFGLYVEHCPPNIKIELDEVYGGCVSAEIHRSDHTLFKNYPEADSITLTSPGDIFADKSLFLVVKNPDYANQGPLAYTLRIRYEVSSMILKGRLLYEFWKYTMPGPDWGDEDAAREVLGDPPGELLYRDLPRLISDLETFLSRLLDPRDPTGPSARERVPQVAAYQVSVGEIAQRVGLDAAAARLLEQGVRGLRSAGLRDHEAAALKSLLALYAGQDRADDRIRVEDRLADLLG